MNKMEHRKAIYSRLTPKSAKAGLRYAAGNTHRTNIFRAAVGLATEMNQLLTASADFLLRGKYSPEDKQELRISLGGMGRYLAILSKETKVWVPTTTKKVALRGTLGAAIFTMNGMVGAILYISGVGVFYGTETKEVDSKIVLDKEAQKFYDDTSKVTIASVVEELYKVYYGFIYALYGEPPEAILSEDLERLFLQSIAK